MLKRNLLEPKHLPNTRVGGENFKARQNAFIIGSSVRLRLRRSAESRSLTSAPFNRDDVIWTVTTLCCISLDVSHAGGPSPLLTASTLLPYLSPATDLPPQICNAVIISALVYRPRSSPSTYATMHVWRGSQTPYNNSATQGNWNKCKGTVYYSQSSLALDLSSSEIFQLNQVETVCGAPGGTWAQIAGGYHVVTNYSHTPRLRRGHLRLFTSK